MKCYHCHTMIEDDSMVCPKCGESQGFDKEIITQAIHGDQDAMAVLYQKTYNQVYVTILSMVRDEEIARDIMQETYIKAFNKLEQLKDPNKFRPWVKRIAHNQTVDHLRKARPILFSELSTEDSTVIDFEEERIDYLPEAVIDRQETQALVRSILGALTESQRLVIGMYYYEGMRIREIAEQLNISENTVKSRLSYGRKKVETEVKELEKKGIKLYGLAPMPFLLLLLRGMEVDAAEAADTAMLQTICQACTDTSVNGSPDAGERGSDSGNTMDGLGKNSTLSKGKAAGLAGKSMAIKVIAGVAVAAVLIGGAIGLTQKDNTDPQNENGAGTKQEETMESQPDNPAQADTQALYTPILDEYRRAMEEGSFTTYDPAAYPNVNEVMMGYYYNYSSGQYPSDTPQHFYYAYADLDKNGTTEMLIGFGESMAPAVVDLYGIADGAPYKLLGSYTLGERSWVDIYPDGAIVLQGSGGYDTMEVAVYRFGENGRMTAPEILIDGSQSLSAQTNAPDEVIADYMGDVQPVTDFDWQLLVADNGGAATAADAGVYINGQDRDAGILTIESDGTIRLEGCQQGSDGYPVVLMEGKATATDTGYTVPVDGEQVSIIHKDAGFVLEVPSALKAKWNVYGERLYQETYLSTGW